MFSPPVCKLMFIVFFLGRNLDIAQVSNILGALQLMLAVSIFQMLCVAEFPLEDADQTFRSSDLDTESP